ncbi:MAG TPA: dienelactone hydrolase family protein [Acidimicrobiia bacterium]
MSGSNVTFLSNGSEGAGYLARPASGQGPGVVVIQEWWGLNDQIREVCDRFAEEGFVALAPDLYRGEVTREPDEAAKLMMALNLERAAKDMVGAVDFLAGNDGVTSQGVGVIGFCMGGGLALWLATLRPEKVEAVAPYYGVIPWPAAQPDYARLTAPVQGHYAELDASADPAAVRALEEQLHGLGKTAEFFIYPGADHAFTNHHRPEVFQAEHAETAWQRTLAFFRANVR